jgi:hypothetical protein
MIMLYYNYLLTSLVWPSLGLSCLSLINLVYVLTFMIIV